MRVISFVSPALSAEESSTAANMVSHGKLLEGGTVALVECLHRSKGDDSPQAGNVSEQHVRSTAESLTNDLSTLAGRGAQVAILDVPSVSSEGFELSVLAADLVVLPIRPVESNFRNLSALVNWIEKRSKPFIFLINDANPDSPDTSAAAIALAQFGTICPILLGDNVDSARDDAAHDVPPMTEQYRKLWKYLLSRVGGIAGEQPEAEAARNSDRRRHPRWDFAAEATLDCDAGVVRCQVTDISAAGIGLTGDDLPPAGTRVNLSIANLGTMPTVVARRRNNRAGLMFAMEPSEQLDLVNRISQLIQASELEEVQDAPSPVSEAANFG